MERTLNIGRLNKVIKINKLVNETDDMGQIVQKMRTVHTVHATLFPIRGSEFYNLKKIQSEVTHKCYIRYLDDIDNTYFIEYNNMIFSIDSVIDVDLNHKFLEILCSNFNGKEVKTYEQSSSS